MHETCEYVPNLFLKKTDSKDNKRISYLSFGDITVENDLFYEYKSFIINVRRLKIKINGKYVHSVKHYNFKNQFGLSGSANIYYAELAQLVREMALFLQKQHLNKERNPEKLVVHCYMGVGRTGMFISLINMYISIKHSLLQPKENKDLEWVMDNVNLCIFSIVRRLREQRAFMVETKEQYKFIYDRITLIAKQALKDLTGKDPDPSIIKKSILEG